jgi:hypothetical protein
VLQLPIIRRRLVKLQATSPLHVVWGRSPAQGVPGEGQYSIVTDMLQLQVDGRRGTSSLQLSRMQATQGREAEGKVTESAKTTTGRCSLPATPAQVYPSRRSCTATAAASAALSCTGLPRFLQAQPTITKSVQAPNANRFFLNDMFTVVATIF